MGNIKILMICLGNICRSPLAEGIMREKIEKYGLAAEVDSCGIGSWHVGSPPDPRSQKTAKKYGIDISRQKCRQISKHDFAAFDLIFVMDNDNLKIVSDMAPSKVNKQKIKMLMNEVHPDKNIPIPDPYLGTEADFEKAFLMIDEACEALAKKLDSSSER